MRVNIGPYKPWYTTTAVEDWYFKRRHDKWSWEFKEKDYDTLDRVVMSILDAWQTYVLMPVNKLINKIPRTEVVVIDYYDSWNAGDTLSLIAAPLLKQLKETKQGSPHVDHEDVPEELRPSQEELETLETWELDEKFFDRWNWVLDEMIYAHETAPTDWQSKYYSGEPDPVFVPVDYDGNTVEEDEAEFFRMDEGPKHTFTVDREGLNAEAARIQNGFRLFGKYYQNLWD